MKILVELEIEGDVENACYVVEQVLDEGLFQESINGHPYDAGPLKVTSAMCRPAPPDPVTK